MATTKTKNKGLVRPFEANGSNGAGLAPIDKFLAEAVALTVKPGTGVIGDDCHGDVMSNSLDINRLDRAVITAYRGVAETRTVGTTSRWSDR